MADNTQQDAAAWGRSSAGWLGRSTTSPEELSVLVESFAQAVWEADALGNVVVDSPSWRAYTGQTLAEWLYAGWVAAVHPDDRAAALRQWEEAVLLQQPVNAEFRLRSPDGHWRWTNVRAIPVYDAQGAVRKWVGLNIDISARKRLEEERRQSEQLIRTLFEQLPGAAAFLVDRQLRYQLADGQALRAVGVTSADFVGRTLSDALDAQTAAIYEPLYRQTLNGESFTHDHIVNGRYFQSKGVPVRTATGEVLAALVVSYDITDRRQAEDRQRQQETTYLSRLQQEVAQRTAELNDSRDLLQTIYNASPNSICLLKPIYGTAGQVADFDLMMLNTFTQQLVGRTAAAVVGRRYTEIFPSATAAGLLERFGQVMLTGATADFEYWYEGEGLHHWFRSIAVRQGDLLLVTTDDITARKQAEAEMGRLKDELIGRTTDKYLTLYNAIDEGFCLIELLYDEAGEPVDFRYLDINPAFARQTGFPNAVGNTIRALAPDVAPDLVRQYAHVDRTGVPSRFMFQVPSDGRWFDISVARIGRPDEHQVTVLFNDVTERVEAERALRASEERMRIAVEAADMGTWAWNLLTNDVYWNEQHFRLFGMEPEPQPIRPDVFLRHVHPDDRNRVEAGLTRAVRERTVYKEEFRAVRDDGVTVWMSGYGRITAELDGRPARMNGVMVEITERKEREINAAFLADIGEAFARLTSSEQIMQAVGEKMYVYFGLSRLTFAYVDESSGRATVLYDQHEPALPDVPRELQIADFLDPVYSDLFHDGRVLVINDVTTDPRTTRRAAGYQALGVLAQLLVPFVHEGQWRFIITLQKSEPYAWLPGQIELVEDLAPRLYLCLERLRFEALRHLTLLQQTEELARMGSWEFDRGTEQFTWSNGMYDLFGLAPGQVVQPETYLANTTPEDQDRAGRMVAYIRRGDGGFEEVMRIRVADVIKTVRVKATVIGRGSRARVLGVDLDITDQLLAQEKIEETAENLQAVLDGSPAAIGLLKAVRSPADPATIVDFQLVVGNRKLSEFFDESLDELLGRSADRFSALLWNGQTLDILRQVRETGQPLYQEQQLPQTGRWLAISVTQQDDGVLLTGLDITELKAIQAQQQHWLRELEESQRSAETLGELRASLQHRSELLRAISHDLRGNFGVIQGALQLLGMAVSEAERSHMMDMVLRNVKQATGLLTDLLDYARLEAGQEQRSLAFMDAAQLLQELGYGLQTMADQQGLELQLTGPARLPVEGDRLHVHRMAQNLLINALRYTHAGRITVSWGADPDEGRWWFSVSDTGPGLAPQLVRLLNGNDPAGVAPAAAQTGFSPGRPPATGEKPAEGDLARLRGEGIGLKIVRQLATLLESRLQVRSEPGAGTQVVVSFPRQYERRQQDAR